MSVQGENETTVKFDVPTIFFYAFTNTKITMAFIRRIRFHILFLQLVLSLLACIDIPPPLFVAVYYSIV